jgi:L-arabinokinase
MTCRAAEASGRLDLLGGVADYSGALVLEVATHVTTTVTAEPDDALVVSPVQLAVDDLRQLSTQPYPDVRAALSPHPRWTHYVIGVALVLVRHGVIEPPRVRLSVTSDVPTSVGVSSSAALEVATARALGADALDPLRLAALCQEAENHVVGAPCGIMDQVVVSTGAPGRLLPILCRPAAVEPVVALPDDLEVVGVPTGAAHDVSGVPYRRARAAAFMGKRIVDAATGERSQWVSELDPDAVAALPEAMAGAGFVARWATTDDPLSPIDPDEVYPVRAATTFGVSEHRRSRALLDVLARRAHDEIAPIMAASHAGYDAMGLGHPAATAVVEHVLDRPGVHGARSSGGGSGGTVVVVCERGALDDVDGLVR